MKKKAFVAMLLACSFAFGTATVTACNITGDGGGTSQGQGTEVQVSGVTLNKPALNLKKGDSETLVATFDPSNATNRQVTWYSDSPDVATVDNSGLVTAVAVGSATVTVKTADGNKTATCVVTVSETEPETVRVESVSLSQTSATLTVDQTVTLKENVLPADANNKKVNWTTDKPAVATVENGVVTAKSVGTAKITVTSEDGNKSAVCTVTVQAAIPSTVKVTGVELDSTSASLKVGETVKLTETVSPANASNKGVTWQSGNTAVATVDDNGLVTAKSSGSTTITVKTADGNFTAACAVTVQKSAPDPVIDAKISYTYAGNECAAFEWGDSNAANAKVEYKLSTATSYTALSGNDKTYLVRQKSSTTARVDIVGLKGGAVYDFKITPSSGEPLNANGVTIHSYDRSGYAHFGKTDGVGAYKDDGTPKDNAVIVYVNEANKNTVTANGQTGIVNILKNAGTSKPLIVRVVGTVGAATWNKLDYNADNQYSPANTMSPETVKGVNGTVLAKTAWTQEDLISGGYNSLNYEPEEYGGERCDELLNLSSKIKWDSSKNEFDSCWNDCNISNVKDVTVEGIGEDARIFQWGMTFKSSNSVEVRNLTFDDYTEDACSFEGSETSASSLSSFKSKNFWVHHNTFEEGVNYWDVCKEQDKHDGDGSTDFKGLSNVTISYNVYNGTHKTGLIGGSNSQTTANVTFHHNYYNGCKSRLPLARQANMHMYNNYYNATTSTDISLRAGAYALVENCYFSSTNATNVELQHDSTYKDGAAKIVNCVFAKEKITLASGVDSNHLYKGSDRLAAVTNDNKFSQTFDTDSSVFYYDGANKRSNVTQMLTADETKTIVPKLAGVQQRNGDVTLGGTGGANQGGSTGGETTAHNYSFSYEKLTGVSSLADNAALTQANFTGDIAFLIIGDGVTFRDSSKKCIQSVNSGLSVEFVGTGTITVKFSSTGSSNESRIGLRAADGTFVAASSMDSAVTAITDGNDAGCYSMTGTTQKTITFTVTKAGVYSIYCPNGETGRGARIFSVVMTDNC